ncbi:hypothetical protein H9L01_01400 [Erysipelothrix inopinata]|uniref:Uncharacterized protein n=1 Tax=Erysipelothrix inopinata TaxID=225084 RepID=A0A7G9RZM3_9FIRM|nr:hypothetical protein [Erysipelothrix inopinata]QNN61048.1 hypothetical protein H9L01_01400 [Erysipelothrix inopinata]
MVVLLLVGFVLIYHSELYQIIILRRWNLRYSYKNLNFSSKKILISYSIIALSQGIHIFRQKFIWKDIVVYLLFIILGTYQILSVLLSYSKDYEYFENYASLLVQICSEYESNASLYICMESLLSQQVYFEEEINHLFNELRSGKLERNSYLKISSHYLYQSLVKTIEFNEKFGDEMYQDKLNRILNEIDVWYDTIYKHQYEIHKFQKQIMMLIGCGLVVSYFSLNMLNQIGDIINSNTSNIFILGFYIVNILIYQKSIGIYRNAFDCEVENVDW